MSIATEIERIKKAKESIINTLKANDIQIEENATIDEVDIIMNDVPILDTSDATATAEDVLKDKTFYANGEKLVGTNKGNNLTKDTPIEMDDVSGNVKIEITRKNILDVSAMKRFDAYECEYKLIDTGLRVTTWFDTGWIIARFITVPVEQYKGKSVTLSAYAKSSSTNKGMLWIGIGDNTGHNTVDRVVSEQTTDGQLQATLNIREDLASNLTHIIILFYGRTEVDGSPARAYVDYTNIQLEVGDTMTEYTPYMGDNQTIISNGIATGDKVKISLI